MQEEVTAALQEQMFRSVIAFARTGNPNNPTIPEWPACTPEKESVMVFDNTCRVLTNFDHQLIPELCRVMLPVFARQREERMAKVQH